MRRGRTGTAPPALVFSRYGGRPIAPVRTARERTLHLRVDIQAVFAEGTPWQTAWMKRVLSKVALLM
jgi:hypothetical protein